MGLTTYRFHVKAFNYLEQEGVASEKIAVRTGEPGKPSAPCELACTRHGQKSIQITWKAPADHGGAPIRYYRIYKNGHHLAFVSALAGTIPSFVDDTVTPNELCTYRVSAWHNLPPAGCDETHIPMEPSPDRFDWFKASVGRSPIEGLLSEPLGVKADDMLQMPRLNDAKPHILLQGFNWVSSRNPYGWYKVVKNKLPDIKRLGASIIWLPPPTESVAAEGYMPTRWYNLNSKYGSQEDLKALIRTAADEYNLSCCVDVVANHRSATKQDKRGHWTVFEDPHWGPWAIVCNNLQGYKGEGGFDTGTRVDCAPDLDHTNKRVQEDVKKWLSWLVREIGYTSIRLDMAGGYGVAFQKSYIDSVDRPFTVGEYWDGCTETLANYVRAGQGSLAAFDFALYYVLKRCVESQRFHEMNSCGRINGLIGLEPQLAVTFIENHDTDHLDYCTTFGGGNLDAVLQGYAFLLTHPGVPSVYWNHFSDYGPYCKEKLQELCDVRVSQGIHSTSGIFMSRTEEGLYAAYISSQSCYCRPDTANVAMKIGFKDWVPEGHRWKIATCGKNYCVWTR
ncbi:UNVERIFIED_CONTAM: Alpha-amylase AMY3, putative [Hammondia hammondi]|eukprot:XP_008888072.1 Alpha-amylase AMY3, putative [Hammondia hammondi]